jgi:hypothetical protein
MNTTIQIDPALCQNMIESRVQFCESRRQREPNGSTNFVLPPELAKPVKKELTRRNFTCWGTNAYSATGAEIVFVNWGVQHFER